MKVSTSGRSRQEGLNCFALSKAQTVCRPTFDLATIVLSADLTVVSRIFENFVACQAQQFLFRGKDLVFSPWQQ